MDTYPFTMCSNLLTSCWRLVGFTIWWGREGMGEAPVGCPTGEWGTIHNLATPATITQQYCSLFNIHIRLELNQKKNYETKFGHLK